MRLKIIIEKKLLLKQREKEAINFSKNKKKCLDFLQGINGNSLGHAYIKLVRALNHQSKKVWHVSNAFIIPEGEKLAKKIVEKTFADFVMFQNSGAEAKKQQ